MNRLSPMPAAVGENRTPMGVSRPRPPAIARIVAGGTGIVSPPEIISAVSQLAGRRRCSGWHRSGAAAMPQMRCHAAAAHLAKNADPIDMLVAHAEELQTFRHMPPLRAVASDSAACHSGSLRLPVIQAKSAVGAGGDAAKDGPTANAA